MNKCDWCGKVITSEAVKTMGLSASFISEANEQMEVMSGYIAIFCCDGCAWAFSVEVLRLCGLSGKQLRRQLIDFDGLAPGKAAGGMRHDCLVLRMAEIGIRDFAQP